MAKIKVKGQLNRKKVSSNTKQEVRRICISGDPFNSIGQDVQMGADGKLEVTLYRRKEEIAHLSGLKHGDCLDLIYNKGKDSFTVRKVKQPHRKHELIMWLFDLPKLCRTTSEEEYHKALGMQLDRVKSRGENLYWMHEYGGLGYKLAFGQSKKGSDPFCMAGRINPDKADAKMMKSILADADLRRLLAYEDETVRLITGHRFGLKWADFVELDFTD